MSDSGKNPSTAEIPTHYGPLERFDKYVERHIVPTLLIAAAVSIALVVWSNFG